MNYRSILKHNSEIEYINGLTFLLDNYCRVGERSINDHPTSLIKDNEKVNIYINHHKLGYIELDNDIITQVELTDDYANHYRPEVDDALIKCKDSIIKSKMEFMKLDELRDYYFLMNNDELIKVQADNELYARAKVLQMYGKSNIKRVMTRPQFEFILINQKKFVDNKFKDVLTVTKDEAIDLIYLDKILNKG